MWNLGDSRDHRHEEVDEQMKSGVWWALYTALTEAAATAVECLHTDDEQ
jgi:hypothetical protein